MTSRAADDDVDEMEQILDNVRVADANDAGDDDDASLSSSISSGNSDDDLRAKAKEKARKRAAAAHRELIDGVRDTQAGKMVHHAAKTLSTWTNLAGQRVGKLLALARGSKGKGWDLDELELSRIHALTRKLRNEGNRVLEILLSMEDDAREIETQLYDMERDFADGALSVDDESLIPELEAQLEEVEGEHSELDKYYQVLECLMTCVHGFLNLKGLPNTMNRIGQGAERNRVIAMLRAMGVDEIPGQLSGVIRGMRGKEIASVWGDSYAIVTAIQEMEKHVRALEEIGQLVDDDLLDELGAASTELTHEAYERATQRQLGSHPINADWYDDDEYADSYAGSLDEDDVEYDSQYADETYTEYTDDTPGYIQQLRDDARPLRTGLKWGRSRRAATTVASHPVDDVDDAVSELDGPTLGSSVGDVVHAVQKGGNRAQEERRSVLSESKSGGDEEREGEGEDEDGAIAALDDWASRGGRAFEAAASAAGADVDAAIDDTLDALSAGASASSSGRDGLVALPPPPPAAEDSSFDAYASTGALPATAMMSHPLDFDAASVSEVASRMSSFGPGEPRPSPRRSHSARQLHGIVTSHSLRSLRPDVSGPLDVGARATTDDGRADDDGDAAEAFPGFSPLVSPAFAGPQKTVRLSSPRLPPRPPTPDSTHATSAGTGLTSHDVSARLSTGSVTPRSTTGRTSAPSETPPDVGARQAGSEVVESVASARGASLPATPRDHTAVSIAVVSSAASGSEMEFFEPLVTPGRELLKQMLPGQSPDDAKPSSPLGSHVERKSDAAEVASAPDLDAAGIAVEVVEASLAEAEPVGQEPEPRTPRMDEAGGDVATGGGVSPLTGRLKERMDSVRANTEKRSALAAKRIEALRSRVPPDRASQELAEGPVGSTAASATRRSRSSTPLRSPSGKYSVGRASLTGHPLDGSEVDRASTRSSLAPTPLRIQFGGSSSRESSDGDGDGDDAASRDGSAVELTLLPAEGEDASAAVGSISLVARSRGSSDPAKSLSFQNTPTPLPGVEEGSVHAPSPDTSADVAAAVATPAPAAARAVPDAEAAGGGAAKAGKKGGCFGGCC
ncbi:unnamed protein product [Pedinophyceae sp. YPF-701]|nr:unnamed protein product [Pedinophyceae sp. YPF-701]